jgi:hypothetical protein
MSLEDCHLAAQRVVRGHPRYDEKENKSERNQGDDCADDELREANDAVHACSIARRASGVTRKSRQAVVGLCGALALGRPSGARGASTAGQ